MKNLYKQSGHNPKYPDLIETWTPFEQPIPEWLSDRVKVKFIDALGNISLDYRETTTGGLEFLGTAGEGVVIKVSGKEDYICYGDGRIFTLRPTQLELLYIPAEKKNRGRRN